MLAARERADPSLTIFSIVCPIFARTHAPLLICDEATSALALLAEHAAYDHIVSATE